jgi:hypothetical protein
MKQILFFYLLFLCIVSPPKANGQSGSTSLLSIDANGKLIYHPDSRGNIVPDFSWVGYKQGELPIPTIPIAKTISAISGDNLTNIQSAINELEAKIPDVNGFRGTLLLKAGIYKVSNTLTIKKSGIVLKGEGTGTNGTRLVATKKSQHTLIEITGTAKTLNIAASRKKITDPYVSIGARTITVEAGHSFSIGDRIYLESQPNQDWINLLGMNHLNATDPADSNWTPEQFIIKYKRRVVAVNGNAITIDAPVVDPIDPKYVSGFLYQYTWDGRIENSGVEMMQLESEYASDTDEQHGWDAVDFINAENCWMQKVDVYYFGYSAANITDGSYLISVLNCKYIDPKSLIKSERRYSFYCNGDQCLLKDCYTKNGRHDYVTGSKVPGPNAFVNCQAELQQADIGPHQRWSTGILYDNITGDGFMNAQNRKNSGSGHGWAGSQVMFWNCKGDTFIVHDPPSDYTNWAIGCEGVITNVGTDTTEPLGFVESQNNLVYPGSLYERQLCERLKKTDCNVITTLYDLADNLSTSTLSEFPNPFNISAEVNYSLKETGPVKLIIYDSKGACIRMLVNKKQTSGMNKIIWDGRDDSANEVAKGLYLIVLETNHNLQSSRIIFSGR